MKRVVICITLLISICLSVKGQTFTDSLETDTLRFHHFTVTIKYPASYSKDTVVDSGCNITYYASQPTGSKLIIMYGDCELSFEENCTVTGEFETDDRLIMKRTCPLNQHARIDFFKGSRIKVAYQDVPVDEVEQFEFIVDSAVVNRFSRN